MPAPRDGPSRTQRRGCRGLGCSRRPLLGAPDAQAPSPTGTGPRAAGARRAPRCLSHSLRRGTRPVAAPGGTPSPLSGARTWCAASRRRRPRLRRRHGRRRPSALGGRGDPRCGPASAAAGGPPRPVLGRADPNPRVTSTLRVHGLASSDLRSAPRGRPGRYWRATGAEQGGGVMATRGVYPPPCLPPLPWDRRPPPAPMNSWSDSPGDRP